MNLLDKNFLRNCPITSEDVKRSLYIYGPDIATIKGKSVRQQPSHVPTVNHIPLPMHVKQWHRKITLCVDNFFINGMGFFLTTSRNIPFLTIQSIDSSTYLSPHATPKRH